MLSQYARHLRSPSKILQYCNCDVRVFLDSCCWWGQFQPLVAQSGELSLFATAQEVRAQSGPFARSNGCLDLRQESHTISSPVTAARRGSSRSSTRRPTRPFVTVICSLQIPHTQPFCTAGADICLLSPRPLPPYPQKRRSSGDDWSSKEKTGGARNKMCPKHFNEHLHSMCRHKGSGCGDPQVSARAHA